MPTTLLKRGNLNASFDFTHTKAAAAPFAAQEAPAQVAFSLTGDTSDLTFAHTPVAFTLAGGATTSVDLFTTLTNRLGSTAQSCTKLRMFAFATTGAPTTASLRIEPGASNPAPIGLSSSGTTETPRLEFEAGGGHAILFGKNQTLSTTAKNVKLSNPGSTVITVTSGWLLGGGSLTD